MSGQDIFLRWDDGVRQILSPIADGFLLYEYKPGRPLDGVPTRIYAATPADSAKLAKHIEGRNEVARQMLEVAEAAGINESESESWGRTFARWAWPFGNSDGAGDSAALLTGGVNEPASKDPWWWPFWSEKRNRCRSSAPTGDAQMPDATDLPAEPEQQRQRMQPPSRRQPATIEAEPEKSGTEELIAADEIDGNTTDKPASPPKKNWYWPF